MKAVPKLGFALLLGASVWAADLPEDSPQASGAPHQVTLTYQEFDHSLSDRGLPFILGSKSFLKEPDWQGRTPVRGAWNFGDATESTLRFAWDVADRKLYLDLNHNGDLTDDPEGVRSAPRGSPQRFTGVQLAQVTADGVRRFRYDLSMYRYGNTAYGYAALKSCWTGRLELSGQAWQVGWVQDPFAASSPDHGRFLLLRPREDRAERFHLQNGYPAAIGLRGGLFFQGQAYEVSIESAPEPPSESGQEQLTLRLEEKAVSLGTLQLTGQHLRRVVLTCDRWTTVLDEPSTSVQIPVGTYNRQELGPPKIWVEAGGQAASPYAPGGSSIAPRFTLDADTPTVFVAGGPLTNQVQAVRRGRSLRLSYRLVGAGGVEYRLYPQETGKPPQFVVYRNDRALASGEFEYG